MSFLDEFIAVKVVAGEKDKERMKSRSLHKNASFLLKLFTFGSYKPVSTTTSLIHVHIPATVLSHELLETLRYFNKNGNGKISASKLEEVLRTLRIHSMDEKLMAMVREVECNQDGFIDIKEFMKLNKLISEVCKGLL